MENDINCRQLIACYGSFKDYTLNEPTIKFKPNALIVYFHPHTFSICAVLIQANSFFVLDSLCAYTEIGIEITVRLQSAIYLQHMVMRHCRAKFISFFGNFSRDRI